MDSIGLLSGIADSVELNILSQKCPRKRTGDSRARSDDTCTVFVTLCAAAAALTSYAPSLVAARRQTISWAAGTCTAAAVIVISVGSSREMSFNASGLLTRTVTRNATFV